MSAERDGDVARLARPAAGCDDPDTRPLHRQPCGEPDAAVPWSPGLFDETRAMGDRIAARRASGRPEKQKA